MEDFTAPVLARAVLEGHVLNLHAAFERLPVRPDSLRVTGGLTRSVAWRQALADVFGAEVVAVQGEGAALGAAIHAAWVWGKEAGRDVALGALTAAWVPLDAASRTRPDPAAADAYATLRRLFRALSRRARGLDGADPFELAAALRTRSR